MPQPVRRERAQVGGGEVDQGHHSLVRPRVGGGVEGQAHRDPARRHPVSRRCRRLRAPTPGRGVRAIRRRAAPGRRVPATAPGRGPRPRLHGRASRPWGPWRSSRRGRAHLVLESHGHTCAAERDGGGRRHRAGAQAAEPTVQPAAVEPSASPPAQRRPGWRLRGRDHPLVRRRDHRRAGTRKRNREPQSWPNDAEARRRRRPRATPARATPPATPKSGARPGSRNAALTGPGSLVVGAAGWWCRGEVCEAVPWAEEVVAAADQRGRVVDDLQARSLGVVRHLHHPAGTDQVGIAQDATVGLHDVLVELPDLLVPQPGAEVALGDVPQGVVVPVVRRLDVVERRHALGDVPARRPIEVVSGRTAAAHPPCGLRRGRRAGRRPAAGRR